jgi:hypothetical protein
MKKFSAELKDFINNSKWTFAKTYAATWPHHYIVRERVDAQKKTPMNIDQKWELSLNNI